MLWQGTAGAALNWNDTRSYDGVASVPLWSRAFWTGARPALYPLLVKISGSARGSVIVQSAIFALAWCVLAWAVHGCCGGGRRGAAAAWCVLAFASSAPVMVWNRSRLSESLALSGVAFTFAAALRLAMGFTRLRLVGLAGACALGAGARDSQIAMAGCVLGFTVIWLAWRLVRRGPTRQVALVVIALTIVTGAPALSLAASHRAEPDVMDVYMVRVFPFAGRVAWFGRQGMPDAGAIDAAAAAAAAAPGETPGDPGSAEVVMVNEPHLAAWLSERGASTYTLWMAEHPWSALSQPLQRPERAFNYANGDLMFYAASDRADSPLSPVLWPPAIWLVGIGLLGAGAAAIGDAWRKRAVQVPLVLAAAGLVDMFVSWNADGQEVTRHTLEGFTALRLGLLVFALVGLSALAERIGARRAAARGAERDGPPPVAEEATAGAVAPVYS